MSEVKIRPAVKEDMFAVEQMTRELADHQKMSSFAQLKVRDLQRDGFEMQPPAFYCLVAEVQESPKSRIIGHAVYYPTYSTWHGRSMALQTLYVKTDERRRGVGCKLFNAVAEKACASGCSRLDFHVLKWNEARSFYEKKGAQNLTELEGWCAYRLEGDALLEVASKAE